MLNKHQLIEQIDSTIKRVAAIYEAVDEQLDYRDGGELLDISHGLSQALKFLRSARCRRAGLLENYHDDLSSIQPFGEVEGQGEEVEDD